MRKTVAQRPCPRCGRPLRLSTSNHNRGNPVFCRICYQRDWHRKKHPHYQRNRYRRDPIFRQRERERAKKYRSQCSASEKLVRGRIQNMRRKYGLTLEDYDRMYRKQHGRCFLCGNKPKRGRPLSVDHNKHTKKVRKLLCDDCNRPLGFIERDIAWTRRALRYLKMHEGEN